MQVILARQILFSLLVAAIPALLPVIGLKKLHINAADLGMLYTIMAAGSMITIAFILPWGRAHYSPNTFTRLAAYLLALVILLLAFVSQTQLLVAVAVLILVLLLTFKLLSSPLSIDFTQRLSFELGAVTPLSQNLNFVPQPRDGPVLL